MEKNTGLSTNSYIYLPEHLGARELEIPHDYNPYQLLLLTVMVRNNGAFSEANLENVAPKSFQEATDAAKVQQVIANSVEASDLDDNNKQLIIETLINSDSSEHWENLFGNSYENFNPFSSYFSQNGIRRVIDIPVELRQFIWRTSVISRASSKILSAPYDQDNANGRRFENIDDITSHFPSVKIPSRVIGKDEEQIMKIVNGEEELPSTHISSKFACNILDVIGAGSIARSMRRRQEGDELTSKEHRIAQLGGAVCLALGGINIGKKVIEGRLAWGVNTPRLRTGEDIPKVTFPKPGV